MRAATNIELKIPVVIANIININIINARFPFVFGFEYSDMLSLTKEKSDELYHLLPKLFLARKNKVSSFDLQGSFAITDNIGIMANASFLNVTSDSSDNFNKHSFVEADTGYFMSLGNYGIVQIYGGYGFGKVNSYYDSDLISNFNKATLSRIFLQPSVGLKSDVFDGFLSCRITSVTFFQNKVSESELFVEPALTAKLGYKYFKFIGQFGFLLHLSGRKSEIKTNYLLSLYIIIFIREFIRVKNLKTHCSMLLMVSCNFLHNKQVKTSNKLVT
ncbi:MAG: hypothetical protein JXA77_05910 [Bacteroidales bacterium]|nr:hypothetical protein [Bacteroidales bacterium]MBN2820573.1 hypothetical protein [Bacteroidales bacterium]